MQFYIIDDNPKKNVELLPAYALQKVNVREGWQILSDIGHIYNVQWSTQNKCYSKSHVLTRSFCKNLHEFMRFLVHYQACAYAVGGSYFVKFQEFMRNGKATELSNAIPTERNNNQFVMHYLLTQKADKLTIEEKERLEQLIRE